ncbi:hypothetical protein EAO72_24985 [Streptomyces sp. or43]|nr:hypothetical protein EAO72_24985 [Streptomyces sp. or43]
MAVAAAVLVRGPGRARQAVRALPGPREAAGTSRTRRAAVPGTRSPRRPAREARAAQQRRAAREARAAQERRAARGLRARRAGSSAGTACPRSGPPRSG